MGHSLPPCVEPVALIARYCVGCDLPLRRDAIAADGAVAKQAGRILAAFYICATGFDHALVSFADPFTLRSWAGTEIEGLPSLEEQVRLFGQEVLPELSKR